MATLAVELIWGDKPVTIGEVAQFVAQARAAGADDGTALEVAVEVDDHHTQAGWRVELGEAVHAVEAEVPLRAGTARNLLELLNLLAESDGDVRSLADGIVDARDELLQALLGRVLGSTEDSEYDES